MGEAPAPAAACRRSPGARVRRDTAERGERRAVAAAHRRCRGGVSRRAERRRAVARSGRVRVGQGACRVRHERIRDGNRSAGCLRATILRYFSDPAACEPCASCGNCDRRISIDADARLLMRKILSGIARAGERYGRRKITAMLVGHLDGLPEPLTQLSTTGLLRHELPRTIERWIDAATAAGLIRASNDQYRILGLTPLGREVMTGRVEDIKMNVPVVRQARSRKRRRARVGSPVTQPEPVDQPMETPPADAALVEALRHWRREEASRRSVSAFVVLHDRTLVAIARSVPRSRTELGAVPGVGPS